MQAAVAYQVHEWVVFIALDSAQEVMQSPVESEKCEKVPQFND